MGDEAEPVLFGCPQRALPEVCRGERNARPGLCFRRVFRAVKKGDRLAGQSMTAQAVFYVVKQYAARLGLDSFGPHDMRRTYAKLAHKGKALLEQIQLSLGHASVQNDRTLSGGRAGFGRRPLRDHLGLQLRFRAATM